MAVRSGQFGFAALAVAMVAAATSARAGERPSHAFDDQVAEFARLHGVPERLIHRVILRESRYNPTLVHAGNYGLMQIRYGTARSMGYTGTPAGLRDPKVNMTYAVPYLANAWTVAGHDEDRAVRLYSSGFYYVAKSHGALGTLRTARSEPVAPEPVAAAPAEAPSNPIAALFNALGSAGQASTETAVAEASAAPDATTEAAPAPAKAKHAARPAHVRVAATPPLPPRRDTRS
jgi:hypothetical protein